MAKPFASIGTGDAVLAIVFVVWTILSLIRRARPGLNPRFRRWDLFGLLPTAKLFVSRNTEAEYQLFDRDLFEDERATDWAPSLPEYRRGWLSIVWNPGFKIAAPISKDMDLIVTAMHRRAPRAERAAAELALRACCRRAFPSLQAPPGKAPPEKVWRQYGIFRSGGFASPCVALAYCSERYARPAATDEV